MELQVQWVQQDILLEEEVVLQIVLQFQVFQVLQVEQAVEEQVEKEIL
jgi:hypothetical protein